MGRLGGIIIVEIKGAELEKVLHYYGFLNSNQDVFKIICPFHEDINPSLLVDLTKGEWGCFGCNTVGNAFDFVKEINKEMNDLQCWKEFYKIMYSDEVKHIEIKDRKRKKENTKQLYIEAQDYYFGLMRIDWSKPSEMYKKEYFYLKERGLTADTLKKCGAKITFKWNYPIIFPIKDMGVFKGWVCRTTNKRIEKKRKYLYNKGFIRSTMVVGKYDNHTVFMVEGYFDYLKAKQFGVRYACAIFNWKVTKEQIQLLKKQGVKNIISGLDNDVKGKEGTEYLKEFFNVIPFQFPKGVKDIGEMTEKQFSEAKRKTEEYRRKL